MKLENVGSNQTELTIGKNTILFSYSTPVAAMVCGEFYRTETQWSKTTSKHINNWLDGIIAKYRPQEFFDNLVK